ncbi:MAG: sarcosine oxidase subunit delta [Alsobacter sp.]
MKILTCPVNGARNIDEFQCLGPVRDMPDPDATQDRDWARALFRAENRRGVVTEWWRHVPSNMFFLAERDIVTDEVVRTVLPSGGARP